MELSFLTNSTTQSLTLFGKFYKIVCDLDTKNTENIFNHKESLPHFVKKSIQTISTYHIKIYCDNEVVFESTTVKSFFDGTQYDQKSNILRRTDLGKYFDIISENFSILEIKYLDTTIKFKDFAEFKILKNGLQIYFDKAYDDIEVYFNNESVNRTMFRECFYSDKYVYYFEGNNLRVKYGFENIDNKIENYFDTYDFDTKKLTVNF